MITLYEYGNWENISNRGTLKRTLQEIWQKRLFDEEEMVQDEDVKDNRYQPFLQFDGNQIRAKNYVGFIQNGDDVIEIFPKVFRNIKDSVEYKKLMLRHIFYWFRYCRKWRFPVNQASIDKTDIDEFPELIINLISNQFLETISSHPLTMYQEIEEAMQTPRGSINFKRYAAKSLSYGNYNRVECDYEPFLFDNKVNRAIKYCSRLLLNLTKFHENQRILQEVIFILDEVDDFPCTINDIESITINSFFEDYLFILDSCKLILSQQLYSSNTYDLSQWCLLFPMEYIFEDFLAGFLKTWFSDDWHVHYQKSDRFLALNSEGKKVFNMQHDIFLTAKNETKRKIIIDTKYKLRDINYKNDIKKGISQPDLYQMVSYAFKRGCTDIVLVYPNLSEETKMPDSFVISSGFDGNETINVTAMEIPFWTLMNFNELDTKLKETIAMNLNRL
ncbi:MAG: restriction endonuclease [Firmicutes bacterium]|nr:restriction endonuclease [Bacillota bacterium]